MTLDAALTISSLRAVDLWKLCHKPGYVVGHVQFLDTPDSLRETALDILTTEVERLRGMRCETCHFCVNMGVAEDFWCNLHDKSASTFGHTCGAWEAK